MRAFFLTQYGGFLYTSLAQGDDHYFRGAVMAEFLESIMRGIQNPLTTPRRSPIRPVQVALPDVQAIRAQTGLSQADFAKSIGVKRATLLNWEQKRRIPEGPAQVLLALIEKDPGIVQRVLAGRSIG